MTWPSSPAELRARFDAGEPYLVGIEEEVMLLDPKTLALAHRAEEVLDVLGGDERFRGELPASQVEIVIPPHAAVETAGDALLEGRRTLASATDGLVRPAAAGAHPFSPGIGEITPGKRYREIVETYGRVAQRELVCALQVHVSVGDADRALAVYDAARSFLPQIAALAANAPFYEGLDTGLASVRPLIAALLPRQGVPPAFRSFSGYAEALAWGSTSDSFPDPTMWWWELRPHGGFGTLEFRVPDAQSTIAEAEAVVAVIQALVVWLGSRHAAGEELPVHPRWKIEQNRWSACRHGVDGSMVDLETGRRRSTRELLEQLIQGIGDCAAELGSGAQLAVASRMVEANGPVAQRAAAGSGGPRAVASWLAERFLDPPRG